jgi:hypothetical protein
MEKNRTKRLCKNVSKLVCRGNMQTGLSLVGSSHAQYGNRSLYALCVRGRQGWLQCEEQPYCHKKRRAAEE